MTMDSQFDEQRRRALVAIGSTLYAARADRAWSQERVALEAGISVITYCTLERGFSRGGDLANPTLDTLLRVFAVLDIDPTAVTAGSDDPTSAPSRQEN